MTDKTVIVDESKWGGRWLKSPHAQRYCCLGFACQQIHNIEDIDLTRNTMPADLNLNILKKEPKKRIIEVLEKIAMKHSNILEGQELLSTIRRNYFIIGSADSIAAGVNDFYHRLRAKESKKELKSLLVAMFKAEGIKLKFINGKEEQQ